VRWQLQEAKAKLSELVKRAESEGPQEITVHGQLKAVVLSQAEYEKLRGKKPNLYEFLRASPLVGLDIDFERDRDAPDRATPIDFEKMFGDDQ
jgi:prevent-host-death family protein